MNTGKPSRRTLRFSRSPLIRKCYSNSVKRIWRTSICCWNSLTSNFKGLNRGVKHLDLWSNSKIRNAHMMIEENCRTVIRILKMVKKRISRKRIIQKSLRTPMTVNLRWCWNWIRIAMETRKCNRKCLSKKIKSRSTKDNTSLMIVNRRTREVRITFWVKVRCQQKFYSQKWPKMGWLWPWARCNHKTSIKEML